MTKIAGHTRAKALLMAFTALAGMGGLAQPALARTSAANPVTKTYAFDIPAQSLSRTLTNIASTAGLQVFFPEDGGASGVTAPAIKGRMTADQALAQATAGSGFVYRYARPGVITLVKASVGGNEGEVVTGVVSVEGLAGSPYFGGAGQAAGVNGVNGSRDITATEGTGSFTSGAVTIGSKVPQALKDVPQSISVLTSERLAEQNVTDLTTAMAKLPGITLVQGSSSLESTFYSRGFAITNIQVDGGAPLTTNYGFFPQIDMSIYDHVELLRGADGLFDGYGDPSGTVNLVRKKPLDHSQYTLEAQVGSWQDYRLVADATAPLALDGKLRGRLVMTWQDNRYFYDTAKDDKTLVYGIVELDATPTTLVTAGVNYTRQNSVPWLYGLPRYLDGGDLRLPRSTCLCFDWNRWNFDTTDIFGAIEQQIGDDWKFKLNLDRNRQRSTQKAGYSLQPVNPTNGLGPVLYGNYTATASNQLSAEATLSGSVNLFGQRQEITIGANRVSSNSDGAVGYDSPIPDPYQPYPGGPIYYSGSPYGASPPIDVFSFDPTNPIYSEPPASLANSRYPAYGTVQYGAYINLRLTAFDRLHLTTGVRWSRYQYKYTVDYLCDSIPDADPGYSPSCYGKQIGDVYSTSASAFKDDNISWPPPINISFDVTSSLTAYAGYTTIYQSQGNSLKSDLQPIDPITGSNWEAGAKWVPHNTRINLSLAFFRIIQKGFGTTDGTYDGSTGEFVASDGTRFPNYGNLGGGLYCCFVTDPNQSYKSQGIDLELSGEVKPGWQISASYDYDDTKRVGSSFGSRDGLPLVSIQPKHLYKIWTSYDFGAAGYRGFLDGLVLSAGVQGQSSAYDSGSVCVNLIGTPDPVSGSQSCASYSPPDYVNFDFTVPAYAVLSGRVDYRISDVWSLAINLDNIFDKTYYQTVGSTPTSGNWYGSPRSVTATVRAKW
ncbi:MAG: TonB-dependent siderophore receptor [Novosphingobium sp.]|nr:TonB-dependent siderophore receptor [Novosphingobium sp.]